MLRPFTICICLLFFLPKGGLKAQDIHFSQFQTARSNLNPSLVGDFNGDHRFLAIHRNQWNSVTRPYSTFGASAETRSPAGLEGSSAGISLFHDIAGDSRLRTFRASLTGAYRTFLTQDSSIRLAGGISPRFEQKRINYSTLEFDNQYNGKAYDPKRSTGESFARQKRSYFEMDLGGRLRYQPEADISLQGGAALYNTLRSRQSFFNNDNIRRDRRWSFFMNGEHPITKKKIILHPAAYLGLQGSYHELILGTEAEYILQRSLVSYRSLFAGLWYRTRDAGYVTAGMQYEAWKVGLSYDINLSQLQPASRGRGGFEISVRYIMRSIERPNEAHKTCPTFL